MASSISALNRALNLIPKRAEQRQTQQLRETFADSGVAIALESTDHQILYGRRGTGKTHALRYLESQKSSGSNVAVYVDLRTIGSPDGLFDPEAVPASERAARLLVDLLNVLHDGILRCALEDDALSTDSTFVASLDELLIAISTIRIVGEVATTTESQTKATGSDQSGFKADISGRPTVALSYSAAQSEERHDATKEIRTGRERTALNFADIARAMRLLADSLAVRRVWILLDEWSSLPLDLQPLLGEFLIRCVTPVSKFTVKIAAIEQQTSFRGQHNGRTIGIELGADFAANVNLDEFMVYEGHEEKSIDFFRGLFFKHLTQPTESDEVAPPPMTLDNDVVRLGFTEKRAFEELVRAAEGVPRDAINIAAKAALRASDRAISINDVRESARTWYQLDKEPALKATDRGLDLLNWIIDEVIRGKRARGFLVNQRSASTPLLLRLFDARVLHLVRHGYSAQDEPGERYDVWVIDYGAYVDLIHTKYEPETLFGPDSELAGNVEVPSQDLRAIRRAVLDFEEFLRR